MQDGRIKELRLAGIATLEEANQFLNEYVPRYNRRFTVAPSQPADLHRPKPMPHVLERSLCLKTTRCLRKDFTGVYEGRLYQIQTNLRTTHVVVEEHVDGTLRLTHHGRALAFYMIAARPVPVVEAKPLPRAPAQSRPNQPIRGAHGGGGSEHNTRRRPEHKPDISTLGKRGHF